MNKHLSSVPDQLRNLLKEYNLEKNYLEYEIKNNWSNIVPAQIAKIATPEKVEQGVVYIRVASELWKKEIRPRQKELLQIINTALSESNLKEIKLV